MQAYLTECDAPLADPTQLQIGGKDIGLFIEPVADGAAFYETQAGNKWELHFFKGSQYEQCLAISFASSEPPGTLAKACWLNNNNNAANNPSLIAAASQFIRKSPTLTLGNSKQLTSNRSLIVDRDAFAYFSFDQHQFKRILLCFALAIAYARVFRRCAIDLMRSIRNKQAAETLRLRAQVLGFNAGYHSSLPVQLHRHELRAAWDVISAHFQLQELNQELTRQLSEVAAYLDEQHDKQERSRRERQTIWLSLFALVLTATSLLSLAQLSPEQFLGNMRAWTAWWTS